MTRNEVAIGNTPDDIQVILIYRLCGLFCDWRNEAADKKTDDARATLTRFSYARKTASAMFPRLRKPLLALETSMHLGDLVGARSRWSKVQGKLLEWGHDVPNFRSDAEIEALRHPPFAFAHLFHSWLKDMESGAADVARKRVEDFGYFFISDVPDVIELVGVLLSSMRLGNLEQAKNLWPEFESRLLTVRCEIDDRIRSELHAERASAYRNTENAVEVLPTEDRVDAIAIPTGITETRANEAHTPIPEQHRTKSMTIKERAAAHFRNVDWSIDHKAKVLREMMDDGQIRFEQINPPKGRRWYFDKREI